MRIPKKVIDGRILEMVCGLSGTGKSYFVKNTLLPKMNDGSKPVIIFDRMGEYGGPAAVDCPKKWPFYNSIEEFGQMIEGNGGKIPNTIHVILCEKDEDYSRGIVGLKENRRPVSIVLDEAHDVFSASEFKNVAKNLIGVCRYGRKFAIDLVLISQRTIDVPPDVRSQFDGNVISFRQALKKDVDALERIGCENPGKVLDLDDREYQVFGELPKRIKLN